MNVGYVRFFFRNFSTSTYLPIYCKSCITRVITHQRVRFVCYVRFCGAAVIRIFIRRELRTLGNIYPCNRRTVISCVQFICHAVPFAITFITVRTVYNFPKGYAFTIRHINLHFIQSIIFAQPCTSYACICTCIRIVVRAKEEQKETITNVHIRNRRRFRYHRFGNNQSSIGLNEGYAQTKAYRHQTAQYDA